MARNVHARFGDQAVWFVPEIDGNREDPDPFRVLIQPLTAGELDRLTSQAIARRVRGVKSKAKAEAAVTDGALSMREQIIAACVIGVDGYSLTDAAGTVHEPKNGKELVAAVSMGPPGESAILDEIAQAIQDESVLAEGVLGKYGSGSDCSYAGGGLRPATSSTGAVATVDASGSYVTLGASGSQSGVGDNSTTATGSPTSIRALGTPGSIAVRGRS